MYGAGDRREIFSSRVRAGSRTYYFDIKKNSKDDNYLVISESKKVSEDAERQRHRIMVFEEDIEKFADSFFQIVSYFLKNSVDVPSDDLSNYEDSFVKVLEKLGTLSRHW
jgi:hypothetical protein